MSEAPNPPAGEQQAVGSTPPANNPPQPPQNGTQPPATGEQGTEQGAGGKDALKADLAGERDRRQELEQKFDRLTQGIAQALGIAPAEVTPEQLATQLSETQSERDILQAQVALYQNAPQGVDVQGLLDSTKFNRALKGVDVTDPAAVKAAVTKFVADNPRFATTPPQGGVGDVHAGQQQPPVKRDMDALIRGSFR